MSFPIAGLALLFTIIGGISIRNPDSSWALKRFGPPGASRIPLSQKGTRIQGWFFFAFGVLLFLLAVGER